jgi:hypothetical protein
VSFSTGQAFFIDDYTLKDCITVAGGLILNALIEQPQ